MALYFTNTVRIKPGHNQEYLAWAAKAVPAFERIGVKVLGSFAAIGGDANTAVYLASVPNFAAWEEFLQKAQTDAELQALQREGGEHVDGNVIQALMPIPGSAMQ